jgi:hypothetical protein
MLVKVAEQLILIHSILNDRDTKMKLGHILLTRFSYRANTLVSARKSGDDSWDRLDPLDPTRLDFRFVLFECVCLPNVLEQSNQDFDWVLIIDPDLPMNYRKRLEKLIAKRKRTYLHEFSPNNNLMVLDWLEMMFNIVIPIASFDACCSSSILSKYN